MAQVKGNQKGLLKWVAFNTSYKEALPVDVNTTINKDHGRLEERTCFVYDDLYQIENEWPSVQSIIRIDAKIKETLSEKTSQETRYYISSLNPHAYSAKEFNQIIRSHWSIENSLHHVRDVAFREDASKIRSDQLPTVASLLRSFAINLLNINGYTKKKQTRKFMGWGALDLFGLKGI